MLPLAAYESSSDEESERKPVAAPVPATVIKPNAQATGKRKAPASSSGAKAKKILPSSLLPADIQAALARGADLDSDSDSDTPVVKRPTKGSTLISRLPAPAMKEQAQRIETVHATKATRLDTMMSCPLENDSESDSDEIKIREGRGKSEQSAHKDEQGDDDRNGGDQDEDDDQNEAAERSLDATGFAGLKATPKSNVLFSLHTDELESRSHQQRIPQVSVPGIRVQAAAIVPVSAAAPTQPIQQQPYYQAHAAIPNAAYAANTQYVAAAGAYDSQAYTHVQPQYAAPDAAYDAYAHLHAQVAASTESTEHEKSARRRDREIQQQLLAGNTAVLGQANIRTVQSTSSGWDPAKYTERAKQEAQVMAAYNIGQQGQDQKGMVMQPTRTMNRRHQINSLALAAAQMEISLLDQRGQQNKTKAQTQAKYGW